MEQGSLSLTFIFCLDPKVERKNVRQNFKAFWRNGPTMIEGRDLPEFGAQLNLFAAEFHKRASHRPPR